MCHPHNTHLSHGACGLGCGPAKRRFFSAKEMQEHLVKYRDELKKEIAGLEEHIQEFKK